MLHDPKKLGRVQQLREAGYTAQRLHEGGYTAKQLKVELGCTLQQLAELLQAVERGAVKSMVLAVLKWRSAVVCLWPRARIAIVPRCKTMPRGRLRSICGAPPRRPFARDRYVGVATWIAAMTAIVAVRTTQVATNA